MFHMAQSEAPAQVHTAQSTVSSFYKREQNIQKDVLLNCCWSSEFSTAVCRNLDNALLWLWRVALIWCTNIPHIDTLFYVPTFILYSRYLVPILLRDVLFSASQLFNTIMKILQGFCYVVFNSRKFNLHIFNAFKFNQCFWSIIVVISGKCAQRTTTGVRQRQTSIDLIYTVL
jgi:hypothetical protein